MTDRRIVKSEKAIQSAFLAMLLDVGFDAITVKNLTEKSRYQPEDLLSALSG